MWNGHERGTEDTAFRTKAIQNWIVEKKLNKTTYSNCVNRNIEQTAEKFAKI